MERRFACTQCGACCNRPPELELGEAAAYADTFVLRLMLRIYSLPRALGDDVSDLPREEASAEYYESKRLLSQFAATSWPAKVRRAGRVIEYVQYLSLSVLPLDLGSGACPALSDNRCSIYERRPLSCRSVPLHYSRPAAAAARDLDAFVATSGFACATGLDEPVIIADGAITDSATLAARADAAMQAEQDRAWKAALVKAMKLGQFGLPSPKEVEAQASRGALTVSMLPAWRAADGAGLFAAQPLLEAQSGLIERTLDGAGLPLDTVSTLAAMLQEYRPANRRV